jgi:predicted nucleic acid-binding protein
MNYVMDASVAVKWVLPEIDSPIALRLRSEARAGLHQLIAPDIYPFEIGNALTRAERKGLISVGDAQTHLLNILATPPVLFDSLILLSRAMSISSAYRTGLYDCLYVALAERRQFQLVTADDKLVKNLQSAFPFILPLALLP